MKYAKLSGEIKYLQDSRFRNKKSQETIDKVVSSLKEILDKKKNEAKNQNYIQKMCEFEDQRRKIDDTKKKGAFESIKMQHEKISEKLKDEMKHRINDDGNDEDERNKDE